MLTKIQEVSTMKSKDRAGIHGIRAAAFMEYGHQGNIRALTEANMAVELDRTQAEWHFLVGKTMGRIRRASKCFDLVDQVEIDSFNKAKELDKSNPLYVVYIAQVLGEKAFREFKKHYPEYDSEHRKKIKKMQMAAKHKLFEAREMCRDCPHILIRCANCIIRLPDDLVDLKFARECFEKAIELAPNNPMAYHVKAMYHERHGVEIDEALQAYALAAALGNFGAAMDLVRMHHRLKKTDIIEELKQIVENFKQPYNVREAYAQAGSYLLFIKKDIVEAVKYYTKILDMQPLDDSPYALMCHKVMFIRMKDPVNMFDVLFEELTKRTDWKSLAPEEKKVFMEFMMKARKHDDSKKERLSVEKILQLSQVQVEKDIFYRRKGLKRNKNRQLKPFKRWKGKKKEDKNKENNNKNDTLQKRNEKENPKGRGCPQNRGNKSRAASASSVDSDYQRDSVVHGPRGFFLGESTERVHRKELEQADRNRYRHSSSTYSRDSSVSSASSYNTDHRSATRHNSRYSKTNVNSENVKEETNLTAENLKKWDASNTTSLIAGRLSIMSLSSSGSNSRYSQTNVNSENVKEETNLTAENLKKWDASNTTSLIAGRLSIMSLSSSGSVSSSGSMSVKERVKQSYRAMLGYNNNSEQNQGKKNEKGFNKTGSSQSLKHEKTSRNKNDKTFENARPHKSQSSQSLNSQNEGKIKNKYSDGYKPACGSRDSSADSSRSLTFMPNYACKPACGSRDSSVDSSRSLTFMPNFACKSSESDSEKL